ncbi:MAG: monofunctional biosynthetic peptidoglycan transglycosylase [Elusimicrobia bacterium GWC2_64_44]|nr:MAG: monofunctional biosynthetic peptidoglycan transglycosylase [Elusimicrobia bacterium GWC2_64_44]
MKTDHTPKVLSYRLLGGKELAWLAWFFGVLVLLGGLYLVWLPDVGELKKKNPKETSFMLIKERQARAQGKKLPRVMIWKNLGEISENLRYAVLVAEDDGFYRHNGVEWESVKRALAEDWKQKRLAKGGSTITQQLARNLYLSPSKNPLRKLKELLIARRLEGELGKRRILELYLNVAEWGRGIYGAEAAARAYFGKSAAELTPEEGAALAAVLPSPRRYSPVKGTRFMERQKSRIVARMRASGYLPEEELVEEEVVISSETAVWESTAPY